MLDFMVKQARSYVFALQFTYANHEGERHLLDLLGDGSVQRPGSDVRLQIRLFHLEGEGVSSKLLFERTVTTKKYYAHGFEYDPSAGKFSREIVTANLEPGRYRVEVKSLADNPTFAGVPSYLLVDYYANLRFVPNSIVPQGK